MPDVTAYQASILKAGKRVQEGTGGCSQATYETEVAIGSVAPCRQDASYRGVGVPQGQRAQHQPAQPAPLLLRKLPVHARRGQQAWVGSYSSNECWCDTEVLSLSPHCIGSLSFWLHESRCGCVSLLVESFDTLSPEGVGKMDKGCMLFTSCKRISGVQQLVAPGKPPCFQISCTFLLQVQAQPQACTRHRHHVHAAR